MGNDERADISRSIGRLEGKVDLIVDRMTALQGAFETLEAGRLSVLESKVAEQQTKMAIIAAAIPLVISAGFLLIEHFWK